MKRRFFQIHLLTAVVGMLVAAGFVALNLHEQHFTMVQVTYVVNNHKAGIVFRDVYHIGWPSRISYQAYEDGDRAHRKGVDISKLVNARQTGLFGDWVVWTLEDVQREAPELLEKNGWIIERPHPGWFWNDSISRDAIAINAVVAVLSTITVILGMEWFLRRRERAKI